LALFVYTLTGPFVTKPMLGRRMLERAFAAGLSSGWMPGMRSMAVTANYAAGWKNGINPMCWQ